MMTTRYKQMHELRRGMEEEGLRYDNHFRKNEIEYYNPRNEISVIRKATVKPILEKVKIKPIPKKIVVEPTSKPIVIKKTTDKVVVAAVKPDVQPGGKVVEVTAVKPNVQPGGKAVVVEPNANAKKDNTDKLFLYGGLLLLGYMILKPETTVVTKKKVRV